MGSDMGQKTVTIHFCDRCGKQTNGDLVKDRVTLQGVANEREGPGPSFAWKELCLTCEPVVRELIYRTIDAAKLAKPEASAKPDPGPPPPYSLRLPPELEKTPPECSARLSFQMIKHPGDCLECGRFYDERCPHIDVPVYDALVVEKAPNNCNERRKIEGRPYPRICVECKDGPCPNFPKEADRLVPRMK
jgi:hypothetical protein